MFNQINAASTKGDAMRNPGSEEPSGPDADESRPILSTFDDE